MATHTSHLNNLETQLQRPFTSKQPSIIFTTATIKHKAKRDKIHYELHQ